MSLIHPPAVLRLALEPIWSLVFLTRCVACRARQRHALCDRCIENIEPPRGRLCPRCDHPLVDKPCPDCMRVGIPAFERAVAAGPYRGVLKTAILALKFKDGWRLADVLAGRMVVRIEQEGLVPDAVVAVPIDAARRAARGYSQSELLASRLAVRLGRPHLRRVLSRRVHGVVQSTADAEQRHVQVNGIFEAHGELEGRRLLLVDDVMTTAATMQAAAAALRGRGARVWGAVVARQTLRSATGEPRANGNSS